MTRFLLLAILLSLIAWAFWKVIGGIIESFGGVSQKPRLQVKAARDPVCGTWVATRNSLALRAGDTTYYFCSDACRAKFAKGR